MNCFILYKKDKNIFNIANYFVYLVRSCLCFKLHGYLKPVSNNVRSS